MMKKMLGILMVAGALAFAPVHTAFADEAAVEDVVMEEMAAPDEAVTEEMAVEEMAEEEASGEATDSVDEIVLSDEESTEVADEPAEQGSADPDAEAEEGDAAE